MKKILSYTTIIIVCIVVFTSCKKYLDINQNPNAAAEPPIKGLLANITYGTAENIFRASNLTSYYSQYLASPNVSAATDVYDNINAGPVWTGFYDIMTDLYDMRKIAAQKNLNAYIGVSDILMAVHLNTLTNLWGNVPYSESFLGSENLTPKFDDAKSLFDTCISLLDNGIAFLQQPDAVSGIDAASDFIHSGNVTAWIKTAHVLKARMLNQLSKTSGYNAANVLTELAAGYKANSDDAQVTAYVTDVNPNPWGEVAIANAGLDLDGWLSSYFVDATNGTIYGIFDPRLPLITQQNKNGIYIGTPNGKGRVGTGTTHDEVYLDVDKWYSSPESPLQIVTFAEAKFIEAEAQFRAANKQGAYDAYLQGIIAHMQKLGVPDTAITRYTTDPEAVAVGPANITLALIMKEKYVACFLSPLTWDDMRRTDYSYKGFTLPVNALLSTFIRRVNYPNNELSTNGKNAPTVALTDHLWWDQ